MTRAEEVVRVLQLAQASAVAAEVGHTYSETRIYIEKNTKSDEGCLMFSFVPILHTA
jgi:hypothetical protein